MTATPLSLVLERSEAETATGGTWIGSARSVTLRGAAVDSRLVRPGGLFVCLAGRNADGHDFAATAVGDGAALVLASRPLDLPVPVLVSPDTVQALGRLAAWVRSHLDAMTWIGVTGSNGKTTVKELITAALGPHARALGGEVHCTRGNLNNTLGVPLSIFATPPGARFAVIEMGANAPGEIAALAAIVRPSLGVITSIGPAHLAGFGSLLGVARAKGELFRALPPGAQAILGTTGLDDACALVREDAALVRGALAEAAQGRRLRLIGSQDDHDGDDAGLRGRWDAEGITLGSQAGEARIALLGEHNLANARIAYAIAAAAGAAPRSILAGLSACQAVPGRLRRLRRGDHTILDDSYNANPASMLQGLRVLARSPGNRLAVLGGMGELGPDSRRLHHEVGIAAAGLGLPLLGVGDGGLLILRGYVEAHGHAGVAVGDCQAAIQTILRGLDQGPTTILIKASHSSGLDQIVHGLIGGTADEAASSSTIPS